MSQIRNRRILITGAASGMGSIMARRLADLGARLILVDVDGPGLERLAAEIEGLQTLTVDVTDRAAVARLRDEVGQVDVVVNNAGVLATGSYTEIGSSADERVLTVNTLGVHLITKAFLPGLISSDEGHLVMMASAAGLVGVPYQALYSASKWFVTGLAESIRQELHVEGHEHVHVTVVSPGVVGTGFYHEPRAPSLVPILRPEWVVERIIKAVQRNRPYVRAPFMVKMIPLLRGLLPAAATDALGRLLGMHRIVARTPLASSGRETAPEGSRPDAR